MTVSTAPAPWTCNDPSCAVWTPRPHQRGDGGAPADGLHQLVAFRPSRRLPASAGSCRRPPRTICPRASSGKVPPAGYGWDSGPICGGIAAEGTVPVVGQVGGVGHPGVCLRLRAAQPVRDQESIRYRHGELKVGSGAYRYGTGTVRCCVAMDAGPPGGAGGAGCSRVTGDGPERW